MILVDFHAHVGKSQDGGYFPLTRLLQSMDTYRIRHTVIFPVDEPRRGRSYDVLNSKIIRLVRRHPRLIGFMRLDPSAGSYALREIERCFEAGLKGVKLHPRSEDFSPRDAAFLFPHISRFSLPLILHTSHEKHCSPGEWRFLLERYRNIPILLAHGGKDHYHEAARWARSQPNVYLETSTQSYFRTQTMLRIAGARKILFASDLPYSHPGVEIRKFELAATPGQRRIIFEENPGKIFPFLSKKSF